ncbi:MAG: GH1 family beta-glucosidase [Clostridia bacterium]|nr:GH1 family beta-glucosidase [Clostridia bacterium]
MRKFSDDFIFGTACASYQCEGGWNEDGKGLNIWDVFSHTPGKVANGDTGDVACDVYHRYAEDNDLIAGLGVDVHRLSLSWARILPEGTGAVNAAGLAYYDRVVDDLIAKGVKPWITLYHWDLPQALQMKGGWLNRDIVDAFAEYARVVGEHFKGRVDCYMTINEPQCINILGYGNGIHAPGWKLTNADIARVYHNIALAHSAAQDALKAIDGSAQVGVVTTGRLCCPIDPAYEAAAYAKSFDLSENDFNLNGFSHSIFMDLLFFGGYEESAASYLKEASASMPKADWERMRKPDFIGLNVYNGAYTDKDGNILPDPAGRPRTHIGWPITPEVLYYGPRHLYKRYGLPIIITENGLSCNDRVFLDGKVHDPLRIDFLTRYLSELHRTIEDGTPVKGYLHWSLLDNLEWNDGYGQRFGIVYVDFQSLERTPKDSYYWYKDLVKTRTLQG